MKSLYQEFWDNRDVRVDGWLMASGPTPTLVLVALYVAFVKFVGPAFMKNREPYRLKIIMQIYNATQVIFSFWLFYWGTVLAWGRHYSHFCQPVEMDPTPGSLPMQMAEIVWWYYISKFVEFLDTIFFVFRKKTNQITFLHVFHHGLMPMSSWIMFRWVPGGHEIFGGWINAFVHVCMYSYYFLAACGPSVAPYLWWKKYLTILQLFQFFAVLTKSIMIVSGIADCGYPKWPSIMSVFILSSFIVLFANFYIQSYITKKNKKQGLRDMNKNFISTKEKET